MRHGFRLALRHLQRAHRLVHILLAVLPRLVRQTDSAAGCSICGRQHPVRGIRCPVSNLGTRTVWKSGGFGCPLVDQPSSCLCVIDADAASILRCVRHRRTDRLMRFQKPARYETCRKRTHCSESDEHTCAVSAGGFEGRIPGQSGQARSRRIWRPENRTFLGKSIGSYHGDTCPLHAERF
jgi:hypothetical protein